MSALLTQSKERKNLIRRFNLYGTPGVQTGTFGTYNAISFNGNKIITGSNLSDESFYHEGWKWQSQDKCLHSRCSVSRPVTIGYWYVYIQQRGLF